MGGAAQERIDPSLRSLASSEGRRRVVLILSRQPHRDIVRHAEESRLAQKQADQQRLISAESGAAEHDLLALPWDADNARADLQRVVMETRSAAMEQIRRIIQPQQSRVMQLLRSGGAGNIRAYTVVNAITAEIPLSMLAALGEDPDVAEVFPAQRFHPVLYVSVPAILAPTFWSHHSAGTGESVGVLDTGVYTGNTGFTGLNIVSYVSLAEGSQDPCFGDDTTPNDNFGHGTHVAGIVASQGPDICYNSEHCIGVAPGLSALYNLKVGWVVKSGGGCPGGGESDDGDVFNAIEWAIANSPVNVFNYSFAAAATGDDDGASQVLDAIEDAWGVNIAIAAGNGGPTPQSVATPGISYNDVTVASVNDQGTVDRSDDTVASYSGLGPTTGGRDKPDICAPGDHTYPVNADDPTPDEGILSTVNSGGYGRMTGTSMASPHVAGALALIRSAGAQDGLAAKAILLNTAYYTKSGWQTDSGWGFVDLSQASNQVNNYFLGSLTPLSFELYSGTVNGTLETTMVWNRHLTSDCTPTSCPASNLGVYAYDGASGNLLGSSTAAKQNVQQIVQSGVDTAVLAVSPLGFASGVTLEPYALAVSAAGFTPRNGPALSVSCAGPAGSVAPNTMFTVLCSVTNTGDLTAFSVNGTVEWQGSPPGTSELLGSPGPGQQTSAQSWQIIAPGAAGLYTLEADVSSASYGQTFTGVVTLPVVVGQAYTLTTNVSPPGSGVVSASPLPAGGVYAAGAQVCLTATPNSGAAFSSWSGAALDSSNCLVMNSNAMVTANFNSSGGGSGNSRSFVSSSGSDANNCSVTANCRTLARALAVTNPGGEIVVVNSGTYAPATIAQPVTISAIGVTASITATSGNALTIDTTGKVTINGLGLHGQGTGNDGVQVQQVGLLRLYNVTAESFSNDGIEFDAAGMLAVYNSRLTDNQYGLAVLNGTAGAFVHNTAFDHNSVAGVYAPFGVAAVSDSSAHYNGAGFESAGGTLVIGRSRAVLNSTGLAASGVTAVLRFSACAAALNSLAAYGLGSPASASGTNEGSTLVVGATSGSPATPANLQ
jgi:serine protease AprX